MRGLSLCTTAKEKDGTAAGLHTLSMLARLSEEVAEKVYDSLKEHRYEAYLLCMRVSTCACVCVCVCVRRFIVARLSEETADNVYVKNIGMHEI